MTRPGRRAGSLGEFGQRALDLAAAGPVTYRDLHLSLGMSREVASYTLRNLLSAGHVVELDRVHVPGARKPVPRVTARPPATVAAKLAALNNWPRSTCTAASAPAA